MQLNKIFKGLVIALPVVTLMACSSSSSVDEQASTNEEAAQTTSSGTDTGSRVETGAAAPTKTPQQVYRETLDALIQDQTVYFDFDRSSIRAADYAVLDKHADFLIKNPNQRLTIEGHCDSRGTPEYNIALGERRAQAVQTYLQNAGVRSSQISVVSYGEEKPAVVGSTEAAFSKNRRGVLVYR